VEKSALIAIMHFENHAGKSGIKRRPLPRPSSLIDGNVLPLHLRDTQMERGVAVFFCSRLSTQQTRERIAPVYPPRTASGSLSENLFAAVDTGPDGS